MAPLLLALYTHTRFLSSILCTFLEAVNFFNRQKFKTDISFDKQFITHEFLKKAHQVMEIKYHLNSRIPKKLAAKSVFFFRCLNY